MLTLVVAVAACGPPERKKRDDTAPDEPQAMVPQTPEEPPFNIGDVEQKCINVEANLAPQSVSSAIVVARLEDRMDILKILTIDVSPPYPGELWLTYRVNSEKDLADNPVALRAKVLADDREIGSFSLVLAEGATNDSGKFAADVELPPFNGGTSAVVITAQSEIGSSEIKHLVHR